MSRLTAILLAFLLSCTAIRPHAAEIYKTVDKDGNVVFSDQPADDAKPVSIGPTNSMGPPSGASRPAAPEGSSEPTAAYYESLDITSPEDGSTINNPVGNVLVQFNLSPQLRDGDTTRLLIDGVPGGIPADGGLLAPTNSRGEHRLEVQVLDPEGSVLRTSAPIQVTVFRSPVRDKPGRPPRQH